MNDRRKINPLKLLIGGLLSLAIIVSLMFIVIIAMPVEHPYVAAKDLTAEVTEKDRPTNFSPCEMHDSATGAICDGQALVVSSERELAYVFKHGVEISGGGRNKLVCLKIDIQNLPYGYVNMSYWNGDFFAGTNENPLNAHIDFGGLEVRIKGGASALFLHKTTQTVIQNLNIVDANNSNDAKLVPMNYATTGPCEHGTTSHDAIYVHTEKEMQDWFASYSNATNPTKTKCLSVKIPFVTTISAVPSTSDLLQPNHYDFGGATIITNKPYILPTTTGAPLITNLIARRTGTNLTAGIVHELKGGTIENCSVFFYGSITTSNTNFGGIASLVGTSGTVKNCNVRFDTSTSASIALSGDKAGGMVGYHYGTIDNSRAEFPRALKVTINSNKFGGLVGFLSQTGKVLKSSAYMDLEYNTSSSGDISQSNNIYSGGLIGYVGAGDSSADSGEVTNCFVGGNDIMSVQYAGGVVGYVSRAVNFKNVYSSAIGVLITASNTNSKKMLGGFVGRVENSGTRELRFEDCVTNTRPFSQTGVYTLHGDYPNLGGFIGYLYISTTKVTFKNCTVSISDRITVVSSGKAVCGGFFGESNSGANSSYAEIRDCKVYNKNPYYFPTGSQCFSGRFSGAAHTQATMGGIVYYHPEDIWRDGHYSDIYVWQPLDNNSWYRRVSSFVHVGAVNPSLMQPNAERAYLNGSSVSQNSNSQVPVSGKQIKFKFTGLADYYLDSIHINMNSLSTSIGIGGYTQIMHDGVLLSDFNARSVVAAVPTAHSRGASNILAQDEFYFYYKSPNTSNSDITVKVQLKHKTTGVKKNFILYNSSQWVQL